MKKWLNIKPKLNDFSEDEFDTDGGDEGMVNCRSIDFYISLFELLMSVWNQNLQVFSQISVTAQRMLATTSLRYMKTTTPLTDHQVL
jgi:hypothetical protein